MSPDRVQFVETNRLSARNEGEERGLKWKKIKGDERPEVRAELPRVHCCGVGNKRIGASSREGINH